MRWRLRTPGRQRAAFLRQPERCTPAVDEAALAERLLNLMEKRAETKRQPVSRDEPPAEPWLPQPFKGLAGAARLTK